MPRQPPSPKGLQPDYNAPTDDLHPDDLEAQPMETQTMQVVDERLKQILRSLKEAQKAGVFVSTDEEAASALERALPNLWPRDFSWSMKLAEVRTALKKLGAPTVHDLHQDANHDKPISDARARAIVDEQLGSAGGSTGASAAEVATANMQAHMSAAMSMLGLPQITPERARQVAREQLASMFTHRAKPLSANLSASVALPGELVLPPGWSAPDDDENLDDEEILTDAEVREIAALVARLAELANWRRRQHDRAIRQLIEDARPIARGSRRKAKRGFLNILRSQLESLEKGF
jgi:hypothetical protein